MPLFCSLARRTGILYHPLITNNWTPSLLRTITHYHGKWNWFIASPRKQHIRNWTCTPDMKMWELLGVTRTKLHFYAIQDSFPYWKFHRDQLATPAWTDRAEYLDNSMAHTEKGVDFKSVVAKILKTFRKHKLWLEPGICRILRSKFKGLGLIISQNMIQMDPTKVKAVSKWLAPKNINAIQRIVSSSNVYPLFIDNSL